MKHVLFFDIGAYNPGRQKLVNLGRQWGIPAADVAVEQVYTAVAGWRDEFRNVGVSDEDIDRCKEIDVLLGEK